MNKVNSMRDDSGRLAETQEEVEGVFVDYFGKWDTYGI